MHYRYMMHVVLAILGICTALSQSAVAQTRLGLHVTQEELNIWRQRMNDSVNSINGYSFRDIYQKRILADANTFRSQSHPGGDGYWAGYTGTGCVPNYNNRSWATGRRNGYLLFKSAFVFLLTGDRSYADPVRKELLNQISLPGTNWADSSKWCPYPSTPDSNAFETIPWLTRLLFAYDYLKAGGYTGFTAQERTNIEKWFHDAGIMWDSLTTGIIQEGFPGAFNNPSDFTCTGWPCTGRPYVLLYHGGPTANEPAGLFNNRAGSVGAFSAIVGVFSNDAKLISHGKVWLQAVLRFGTWSDGSLLDKARWGDCDPPCVRSAWGHAGGQWSNLIGAADTIARTGDTSLYTFQSPGGLYGSGGNNVGVLDVMRHVARLANKTVRHYGTTDSNQLTDQYLITWDSEGDSYWDMLTAIPNLYYRNPEIHTAVTRNLKSGINGCADSQFGGCFSGVYITYPDIPFMFGNMEGVVNPYGRSSVPPRPSNLRILSLE